ncbi:MAG: hypothetical protein ABL986_14115 [Vicinamibacterales bacterium]
MRLAVALVAVLAVAGHAQADDLRVLSAGAREPAIAAAADGFRRQTGHAVRIDFATMTEIRERSTSPLMAELVAAPEGLMRPSPRQIA